MRTGNYQFGGPSGWGADYPDSQDWFDIFMTGSGNQFSNWSSKTYDDAVTAGDATSDNAKRDASYATAEKTLVQEAPVLFLYQQPNVWAVNSKVQSFQVLYDQTVPFENLRKLK